MRFSTMIYLARLTFHDSEFEQCYLLSEIQPVFSLRLIDTILRVLFCELSILCKYKCLVLFSKRDKKADLLKFPSFLLDIHLLEEWTCLLPVVICEGEKIMSHHRKKGNQHARKAVIMIPRVRAAFRSLFILLLAIGCREGSASQSGCGRFPIPAVLIPFIWRCLLSNADATLDLKLNRSMFVIRRYIQPIKANILFSAIKVSLRKSSSTKTVLMRGWKSDHLEFTQEQKVGPRFSRSGTQR